MKLPSYLVKTLMFLLVRDNGGVHTHYHARKSHNVGLFWTHFMCLEWFALNPGNRHRIIRKFHNGTLFDADFVEIDEGDFSRYLMVCHPCLEVKASLKRLKALTYKHG